MPKNDSVAASAMEKTRTPRRAAEFGRRESIAMYCAYTVSNGNLQWQGTTAKKSFAVLGNDITSDLPFSIPQTPAGAIYYRFVSAINLSTADPNYTNRGFKAANIFLNGQIPMKARLTTYQ